MVYNELVLTTREFMRNIFEVRAEPRLLPCTHPATDALCLKHPAACTLLMPARRACPGLTERAQIRPEWLVEIAPHYYKKKDVEDEAGKKMPKRAGKDRAAAPPAETHEGAEHEQRLPKFPFEK